MTGLIVTLSIRRLPVELLVFDSLTRTPAVGGRKRMRTGPGSEMLVQRAISVSVSVDACGAKGFAWHARSATSDRLDQFYQHTCYADLQPRRKVR
ncbi:MAG: hypothetical protein IH625_01705 [Rhodobacteraceae bacterium]|nr:hypothetical protein [Paracoccaceae bacterium]